jgi:hypothetical protein
MYREKIKEWIDRYGFAIILTLVVTIIAANIIKVWITNKIVISVVISFIDSLTFYFIIAYYDLKKKRSIHNKLNFEIYLRQVREMILEFGPAEYLDKILRPIYFSVFIFMLDSYNLAVFLGYMVAEVNYFMLTIFLYEKRKKRNRQR